MITPQNNEVKLSNNLILRKNELKIDKKKSSQLVKPTTNVIRSG
jgi:hypothetical protein